MCIGGVWMNITLSAEKETIERTREYAARHGTTLNRMIRDFMTRVVGSASQADSASEFARVARENAGCSEKGYRFDRDEAHRRGAE